MDFFSNILGQGKNANPSIQQGTSQFEAGNYNEAVKSFEKALKIEP
ncbi:MAG: tetratricopeptide repeat protein, partial [Methanomicrobiales archaeon]|nr:tetratricopeptide repeat protein [Methanomicrobiales archaeon]